DEADPRAAQAEDAADDALDLLTARTGHNGGMALGIEDYALITDCSTAALVGTDGSIDWLCLPRYDSASMFAALLGEPDHGRWLIAPEDAAATATRRYAGDDFALATRWTTAEGEVEVLDVMPRSDGRADVVRRIRGIRG